MKEVPVYLMLLGFTGVLADFIVEGICLRRGPGVIACFCVGVEIIGAIILAGIDLAGN